MIPLIGYDGLSDIRLRRVKYDNVVGELHSIADQFDGVELSVIGQSDGIVFDREESITTFGGMRDIGSRPIYALDIYPENETKGLVFIVAGHHAVEPAGPIAALEFTERFLRSDSLLAQTLRDNFHVTVIPVVDVDGYSRKKGERIYSTLNNFYHLLDDEPEFELYRGFHDTYKMWNAGPEAKAVAKAFRDRVGDKPVFTLDLHESSYKERLYPRRGFFVIQYEHTIDTEFAETAVNAVVKAGLPLDGIETERFSSKFLSWTFTQYSEELGAHGLVQESPVWKKKSKVKLSKRVEMHLRSMDAVIAQYINEVCPWARATEATLSLAEGYVPGDGKNPTESELVDALNKELVRAGVELGCPIVVE